MSCITIIWSMVASACLTLAAMYFLVWCKRRTAWANLLFSTAAVGTAAAAFFELWMMRAATTEEFGRAVRWDHVPGFVVVLSLVGFIRLYMRAGRRWLAWIVCGMRALSLALNFVFTPNLNYRQITGLRHIRFLGESVSVADGVPNPWMLVGQTSLLLFLAFVVDATLVAWRRGDRRRAILVGGAIMFFTVTGVGQLVLALWGIIHAPLTTSLFYLGIVAAMAYEMSSEMFRAVRLSDQLRESEERMTLAAEAGGVGIWTWNITRNQIWASEIWHRLFGFAPDVAITFEKIIQRIHPDDRERVELAVRRTLKGRNDYSEEYRVALPDGIERWLVAHGRRQVDAHGNPSRMLGATMDITARKQAEVALRVGEERYRILFDRANEGICVLSVDGKLISVNESFAHMHGYTAKEMLGMNLSRLDTPETSRLVPERISRILSGEALVFEVEHYHRAGHVFPLEVSAGRIAMDGEFCIQSFHRDITGRKQAELEIVQQRNDLAHLARVTMLGELAGSLAHELNQPLTAILSNAEAAQLFFDSGAPDLVEIRTILDDIVSADKRAGEIIQRLRSLLKKEEMARHPLEINEVLQEVLKLVRSELVSHGVTVHPILADGLSPISGDRVQLQQVLINLIINACDAMVGNGQGDRKLVVQTDLHDGAVRISIIDCGSGISADILNKIFDSFVTTKPAGIGLGLSVCRRIIAAHQGTISAENNPDRGACFHLTLPAVS